MGPLQPCRRRRYILGISVNLIFSAKTTINTMFSYMEDVTIVVSQIDQYSSITAALNVASLKL